MVRVYTVKPKLPYGVSECSASELPLLIPNCVKWDQPQPFSEFKQFGDRYRSERVRIISGSRIKTTCSSLSKTWC